MVSQKSDLSWGQLLGTHPLIQETDPPSSFSVIFTAQPNLVNLCSFPLGYFPMINVLKRPRGEKKRFGNNFSTLTMWWVPSITFE